MSGQLFYTSNAVQTTLATSLTSGGTSVELTAITGWPTQFPCTLLLEWGTSNQEVVTLTQASTGGGPYTFANCLRGQDGTTGVSHSSGAQANHGVSARDFFQVAPVVNICAYGADPTGTNDSTTAISNAIAAIPAGGGSIYAPPGNYTHSGTLLFNQGQGLTGAGSTATTFTYTGTGIAVNVTLSGSFTGGAFAARFEGFYLTGYGAGASAIGMQVGNLQGLDMRDVAIYGFAGIGLNYLYGTGWAEESTVQARIVQCGTYGTSGSGAVVFDGTSFDYGNYDFTIVTSPGVHGVVLQNGAQLRGANLRMRGNFYARTTANTGAVIAIAPAGGSDTSYITDAFLDVAVESAGTGGQIAHTSVLLGSTNSSSQLTGQGVLSFNPFGPATLYFQGFSNANFLPFGFSGYIQDGTAAGPPYSGDAVTFQGGVAYSPNGHLNSSPGGGVDVYFQFGPICEGLLANGNNTLVFHGAGSGSYLRTVELWLAAARERRGGHGHLACGHQVGERHPAHPVQHQRVRGQAPLHVPG